MDPDINFAEILDPDSQLCTGTVHFYQYFLNNKLNWTPLAQSSLVHARIGEQQSRVVQRNGGGRVDVDVLLLQQKYNITHGSYSRVFTRIKQPKRIPQS